jgi:hypothetical protein
MRHQPARRFVFRHPRRPSFFRKHTLDNLVVIIIITRIIIIIIIIDFGSSRVMSWAAPET